MCGSYCAGTLLGGGEAQGQQVAVQVHAQGFYDEVVVFALGQAGDGDAADDSSSGDVDGEAAAVGGVVGLGQAVFFGDGRSVVLQVQAYRVGAAMEAGDDVRLALHPAGVVGRGAGERGVEERLVRLAEAADVDHDGVAAGDGQLAEGEAQAPGDVVIEGGEDELLFLAGDGADVVLDGHGGESAPAGDGGRG